MPDRENRVTWDAALYIWWGQVWRFSCVNIVVFIIIFGTKKFTPVFYRGFSDLATTYEGTFIILLVAVELLIHMRAIQNSFTDSYPTFTFAAESKWTNQSVFDFDRRLNLHYVILIWWAQVWRMLLIPSAIILGSLAGVWQRHPGASNYITLLDNNLTKANLLAIFVLSIWATKESLGDKYWNFRLISTPKNIYDGVGQ